MVKAMAVLESAIFWIVIAAASEIIALSPLKDNSIIQLVLHAIQSFKPGKKILISLTMVSGYVGLTHAVNLKKFSVLSKRRSSMQLCLTK